MIHRPWLLAVGALAFGALQGCTDYPASPYDGEGVLGEWVRSGSYQRTYELQLPSGYHPLARWPLLIAFHGAGDTGEGFRQRVGLDSVAARNGVIAVFPDAVGGIWGDAGVVDDVRFVRALIWHLRQHLGIDQHRIYVAGFSRGAIFTHTLGCQLADELAGAASVGASMYLTMSILCQPAGELPFLFIHGTQDAYFPYEGALGQLSIDSTAKLWAAHNGCVGAPTLEVLPDTADDGTTVETMRFTECRRSSEVMLQLVRGGGHTWPGAWGRYPDFLGPTSREISANEEILEFLLRHRRP
jgi:polyhydroxybutyrate depolymerase